MTDIRAASKHTLRSIARRWLELEVEIKSTANVLGELTAQAARQLLEAFGIGTDVAAKMLIVAGDNPEGVRAQNRLRQTVRHRAIPASSGKTVRCRVNRGGHRHANAAPLSGRDRAHATPRIDQVLRHQTTHRRKTKAEIIRCLKRLLALEIWAHMRPIREARNVPATGA